jgi:hypothetical protein
MLGPTGLVLAVLFVASLLLYPLVRYRLVASVRGSRSLAEFKSQLGLQGFEEASELVYRHFQSLTKVSDFPVDAADDLYRVYGLVDEDLETELQELSLQCGLAWPLEAWTEPVRTVADVVHLLASELALQSERGQVRP